MNSILISEKMRKRSVPELAVESKVASKSTNALPIEKTENKYCVKIDGKVISSVNFNDYGMDNFDWILLSNIDTDENYRRQGLMKRIIDEIYSDKCQNGKGLYLLVKADNTNAIKAYLKSGFKKLKEYESGNSRFEILTRGNSAKLNQFEGMNFDCGDAAEEGVIKDKLAEARMNPMEKRLTADFNLVKKSYNAFKKPLSFASEKIVHEEDKNHDAKVASKTAGNLAAMFIVTKGACSVIKSNANKIYGTIKDIGVIGALVGGGVNKAADALTGISKATGLSETMVVYLTAVGITIGKKQIDVMTKRTNLNKYSVEYNRALKKVTDIYENVEKTYKAIMDDKDVSSGDEKKRAKDTDRERGVDRNETPEKAEFREDKAFGQMCRHFVEVINTELKKVNANLESLLAECSKLSNEEKEEKKEEVAKVKSGEDDVKKENWRAPKNPEDRAKWIHERRERKREKDEMNHAIGEKDNEKATASYIWSLFEDCYAAFESYYFDTEEDECAIEGKVSDAIDLVKEAKKMISDGIMSGTLIPQWNEAFDERKNAYKKLVEMKKELDNSSLSDEEKNEKTKEYDTKLKEYRSLVKTEQQCRKLLNKALMKRDHKTVDEILSSTDADIPAIEGAISSAIKSINADKEYNRYVTQWNSIFKTLTPLLEDIVSFKKAINDPNTSKEERERCGKLLKEKESAAAVLRGEEKSLRSKIDSECEKRDKKPLLDSIRLSLEKDVYDEFMGGATEGFVEKLDVALSRAGEYTDEFFKTTGVQVAQIIDGSRYKAIELYAKRVKELTQVSKNLSAVDQNDISLKIPALRPDGTVDTEVLKLKEKGYKGELNNAELKRLIAKGLAYYTKMLKNTKDN